jgi:uncharacterized protein
MIDKLTISKLALLIASKIEPDKIFLIGSYATGKADEDSDIDFLVIKDTTEPKHKRSIEIQKLFIGTKLPTDILVYTKNEFEEEKLKKFSFINTTIQEAQLLYERKQ